MKVLLFALLICLVCASGVFAVIPAEPNYTLLWNDFDAVTVVDSFAIATSQDGLVVLVRDTLTGQYNEVSHVFLEAGSTQHKRSGDLLSVRTDANVIYFFDLADLPNVTLLGTADIGEPFLDYAFSGEDLYICAGFDGLHRYRMNGYSSAEFADSSMLGIHYTRVEIYGDELYTLDDYNGVLRYDISGDGFGQFTDYLFIPFQAQSFVKQGDTLLVAASGSSVLAATVSTSPPQLLDTIHLAIEPDRLFVRDTIAVAFSSWLQVAEYINLNNFLVFTTQSTVKLAPGLAGDVFTRDGDIHLMMPTDAGGLIEYNASTIHIDQQGKQVLARPGPVVDLQTVNGYLYAAGGANPPDRYTLAGDGQPVYDRTFFPGIQNISAMTLNGDTMFVMYSDIELLFMWNLANDTLPYMGAVLPSSEDIQDIILTNDCPVDSVQCFIAQGQRSLDIISVSDSGRILPQVQVGTIDQIATAALMDSLLFVASSKTGIAVYRVFGDFGIELRRNISLSFPATHIIPRGDKLWVFAARELLVWDVPDPTNMSIDTVIALPHRVSSAVIDDGLLYTVGATGIGLYEIVNGLPTLIDEGGRGGEIIAADDGVALISNGRSVHSYYLLNAKTDVPDERLELPAVADLHQNYPNPFNPTTTISFSLARQSHISLNVYNVLGQTVRRLLDADRAAGAHVIQWDGRDNSGNDVASGVYFYRLVADDFESSRKMLLIR